MSTEEKCKELFGEEPWHGLGVLTPARIKAVRLLDDYDRSDGEEKSMKPTQSAEIFNEKAIQKAVDEFAHRHCIAAGPSIWVDVSGYRSIVIPNSQDSLLVAGDLIQQTIEAVRDDGEDWVNFWYIVGRANLDCALAEKVIAQDKRFETRRKGNGADTDVQVGLKRKGGEGDG